MRLVTSSEPCREDEGVCGVQKGYCLGVDFAVDDEYPRNDDGTRVCIAESVLEWMDRLSCRQDLAVDLVAELSGKQLQL